jgi:hypothetical protein
MRAQPDRLPRRTERRTPEGARKGYEFPRAARRRAHAVPRLHEREARPEGDDGFVLLDGIRPALVAEDLLGRPGHPGRRLPQGGFGQERPDGRRGPFVPLRLFHAASFGAGGAGGDLRGAEFL